MVFAKPARDAQSARRRPGGSPEDGERLNKVVKAFLGADACEIANRVRRMFARFTRSAMTSQVKARMHDVDAFSRQSQVTGHEVGVIIARGKVGINRCRILADQLQRPLPMYGRQCFEKDIVALQRSEDRNAKRLV